MNVNTEHTFPLLPWESTHPFLSMTEEMPIRLFLTTAFLMLLSPCLPISVFFPLLATTWVLTASRLLHKRPCFEMIVIEHSDSSKLKQLAIRVIDSTLLKSWYLRGGTANRLCCNGWEADLWPRSSAALLSLIVQAESTRERSTGGHLLWRACREEPKKAFCVVKEVAMASGFLMCYVQEKEVCGRVWVVVSFRR